MSDKITSSCALIGELQRCQSPILDAVLPQIGGVSLFRQCRPSFHRLHDLAINASLRALHHFKSRLVNKVVTFKEACLADVLLVAHYIQNTIIFRRRLLCFALVEAGTVV